MALEAVVFSQAGGHFGYGRVDSPYALPAWCDVPGAGFGFAGNCWDNEGFFAPPDMADEWEDTASGKQDRQSSEASTEGKGACSEPAAGRRKRRRAKVVKNREEMETQRMTHIAVERNRRRQMNEYLAVLRSLMPPSYAHRGDQASIVGGAINYVRELEQQLQSLQVQKSIKNRAPAGCGCTDAAANSPFAGFFTFPQYSTTSSSSHAGCSSTSTTSNAGAAGSAAESGGLQPAAAVADIEVTMVEGHASLKVLAPRRPKQLLRLVAGLQQLRVPPLHLNMTSLDAMVLYTFSLKVEDDSMMGSVEDIAAAVHEILKQQEETAVM